MVVVQERIPEKWVLAKCHRLRGTLERQKSKPCRRGSQGTGPDVLVGGGGMCWWSE